MKIGVISRILKEDLSKSGDEMPKWIDSLLSPLNQFVERVGAAVKGRLTVGENIAGTYIDQKLTSGTKTTLSVKDSRPIKGVWPVYAEAKQITGWQFDYKDVGRIDFTITFSGGGTADTRILVFFA